LTKEISVSKRTSLAVLAFVVGTVFVVGCAQTSSPVNPSSSAASSVSALALGATAVATQSQPSITHLQVPITVISIPSYLCPGQPTETINVSGTANLTIISFADAANAFHFTIRLNTQGIQGVGEQTGTVYQFIAVNGASEYEALPYPFTLSAPFTIELISHGNAANVNIETVGHFTFNADGSITANLSNGNISCE
jgi:hypothetical protein